MATADVKGLTPNDVHQSVTVTPTSLPGRRRVLPWQRVGGKCRRAVTSCWEPAHRAHSRRWWPTWQTPRQTL